MSSATAMEKHKGGVAEYRLDTIARFHFPDADTDINLFRASEGKTVEVPYRGDVNATMLQVLGGIRSACTYVGAGKLKEMSKRTTFIRVTQQLNEIFSGGDYLLLLLLY